MKNLSQGIRKITPSKISGSYFRLVSPKRKDQILDPQGSFANGGRYNPPEEFGALYLGETEEVCRAERNRKSSEALLVPQVLGKIKISYKKVLDLTDGKTIKKLKIKKDEIVRDQKNQGWDLTWNIARLAYRLGFQAILAPSITGKGNNLIIFDKHLQSGKIKLISQHT